MRKRAARQKDNAGLGGIETILCLFLFFPPRLPGLPAKGFGIHNQTEEGKTRTMTGSSRHSIKELLRLGGSRGITFP
jgi:hypothetical protein